MIGIIIFYLIIKAFLLDKFPIQIPYKEIISKFWSHFNIDSIAVGGFFAVLLFKKHSILKYIINNKTFYSILLITIAFLLFVVKIPFFHYLTYSFLFGIIIINLAANTNLKNVLEWSVINYLGRISYGIYMYHFLVMILVLLFASKFNIETNWVIYPLILLGTIGISSISYHYFEVIFLKLKTKYTFIRSGGNKL